MLTEYQIRSLLEDLDAFKGIALLLCEEDPIAKAEAVVIFRDLEDLLQGHTEATETNEGWEAQYNELQEEHEALEKENKEMEEEKDKAKTELENSDLEVVAMRELCAKHGVPLNDVDSIARSHA